MPAVKKIDMVELYQLRSEGKTTREIAAHFGTSQSAVTRKLNPKKQAVQCFKNWSPSAQLNWRSFWASCDMQETIYALNRLMQRNIFNL